MKCGRGMEYTDATLSVSVTKLGNANQDKVKSMFKATFKAM